MTKADDPAVNDVDYLSSGEHVHDPYKNLTKREYFAAMAMQGILANGIAHERGFTIDKKDMPVVDGAIYIADALIAALSEDKK